MTIKDLYAAPRPAVSSLPESGATSPDRVRARPASIVRAVSTAQLPPDFPGMGRNRPAAGFSSRLRLRHFWNERYNTGRFAICPLARFEAFRAPRPGTPNLFGENPNETGGNHPGHDGFGSA